MTEVVTGIHGSQSKRRDAATTARNTSKERLKNLTPYIVGVVVFLALLTWWQLLRPSEPREATVETSAVRETERSKKVAPPRAEGMVGVPTGVTNPGVTPKDYKVEIAKGERTKPVRVMQHECIRWWGQNPDAKEFTVLVRGVDDSTWYTWEAYLGFKKAGKIPYDSPGWYAFEGNVEEGVEAFYHIGLRDQCS